MSAALPLWCAGTLIAYLAAQLLGPRRSTAAIVLFACVVVALTLTVLGHPLPAVVIGAASGGLTGGLIVRAAHRLGWAQIPGYKFASPVADQAPESSRPTASASPSDTAAERASEEATEAEPEAEEATPPEATKAPTKANSDKAKPKKSSKRSKKKAGKGKSTSKKEAHDSQVSAEEAAHIAAEEAAKIAAKVAAEEAAKITAAAIAGQTDKSEAESTRRKLQEVEQTSLRLEEEKRAAERLLAEEKAHAEQLAAEATRLAEEKAAAEQALAEERLESDLHRSFARQASERASAPDADRQSSDSHRALSSSEVTMTGVPAGPASIPRGVFAEDDEAPIALVAPKGGVEVLFESETENLDDYLAPAECPRCAAPCDPNAKFCASCSAPVVKWTCKVCSYRNAPEADFCVRCQHPVELLASPMDVEIIE